MRLLVTGGAGYIGSICTKLLLDAGHSVVVVDDLSTGHRDAVDQRAEFIEAQVHDAADFVSSDLDAVLHFAAASLVGESVEHPERYWENNIVGGIRLIEAIRSAGIKIMVFSSTAAVYGNGDGTALTETSPTAPINPYGASKLAIDHMLTAEARAHGLGAVSLRYFNVVGAYGDLGERHPQETHLLPRLLDAARNGTGATVYGTDYPTSDGTCVRDYLHVLDLAEAHLLALRAATPGEHHILNLGTGLGHTVSEVLRVVADVTSLPLEVEQYPRRDGDPAVLVAANVAASEVLGWTPTRTLTDAVRDAWSFMQQD
ncbi:MAG: UDP-glucose 4-epimerase GalE [Cumulibacter sp.]